MCVHGVSEAAAPRRVRVSYQARELATISAIFAQPSRPAISLNLLSTRRDGCIWRRTTSSSTGATTR